MTPGDQSTWHEKGSMGIRVEDTEVGREVSIYEYSPDLEEWRRRYTMPAGAARELHEILGKVVPDAE